MIYKDLRGFIKQVDDLGALRRINGADQRYEIQRRDERVGALESWAHGLEARAERLLKEFFQSRR